MVQRAERRPSQPHVLPMPRLPGLSALAFLVSVVLIAYDSPAAADEPPVPDPPREFRGGGAAPVANIDWPSKPGLPVEQQRKELLAIIQKAHALNLNAVIFQVRPMADALYPSQLEPWSEFLTGKAGKPPEPAWDPL